MDTGIAVNPDTIVAQLQGGLIFGLTAALFGEITIDKAASANPTSTTTACCACEQRGTYTPARDRMGGRWRLGDRFAGSAGELLADVLDHLPLPRNELQCLGHVLTDLAQSAVTTAGADCWGRIDDALARQMRGPADGAPARRRAPLER